MDNIQFTKGWLLCKVSFGDFKEGVKYSLQATLVVSTYFVESESGETFNDVVVPDETLFANFEQVINQ